ncbi:hypothetical protein F8M41_009082 [Gigaspora margarita]|uniref:DUF7729 domain-containing protein n=1 Tax=Gigaspora margarita TaxID=4874 RepID=A0A8H4AVH6_GIGMA|nr:hypothetical protein F8M41_009082 [Gigaspora margarita]
MLLKKFFIIIVLLALTTVGSTIPSKLLQYLDSIDEFSNNICSVPKCADEDVQKTIQAIESGCQTDLNNNNTLAELIYGVFVFYSPLRDSICFKNHDEFCVHETLNTTLNLPDSPIKITGIPIIDAIAVADSKPVCTKCNKDIIRTFGMFIKNNTLALQVLAHAGINQNSIDTMRIGIAVKCSIKFLENCS